MQWRVDTSKRVMTHTRHTVALSPLSLCPLHECSAEISCVRWLMMKQILRTTIHKYAETTIL